MRGFQAPASWTISQQGLIVKKICLLKLREEALDLRCWSGTSHGALSAAMTKRTACEPQWNALRNTVKRARRCETQSETHSETQRETL